MRQFLEIIDTLSESKDIGTIKKTIISLIKDTQEEPTLQKVLKTLEAGNLDDRISEIVKTDEDARSFIDEITNAIVRSDAPLDEKEEFLKKYPKGIINVSKLLDGSIHTFGELVGEGFPEALFSQLAVSLTSQGVGPGEVALAVFSPKIKWSGRVAGGGDIVVGGKNIEVKTSIKSGGRWINARKANMNMNAIKDAVESATGLEVSSRLGLPAWISTFRPTIDKKRLSGVCKVIAKSLFTVVETSALEKALASGDVAEIQDEVLRTGYENYKKLSEFDGMLLMDVATKTAKYFSSYEDMRGDIKVSSIYLYAPESEAMPKVSLSGAGAAASKSTTSSSDDKTRSSKPVPSKNDLERGAADIVAGRAKRSSSDGPKKSAGSSSGVGRAKR